MRHLEEVTPTSWPILLARTRNSELVMYHSRSFAQEQLKIRFKKIQHCLILR